jgi:hypothetical protein
LINAGSVRVIVQQMLRTIDNGRATDMAKLMVLTKFLDRLDSADIHYSLSSVREGAIMVGVTVPEERWEIEFQANGEVEIEVFQSDGEVYDDSILEDLFQRKVKS